MMKFKETNNFYQIKSDSYRSGKFITFSMSKIGGTIVFVEFTNDLDEKLALDFDSISKAIEWIDKGFWVDICVTVYR